MKIFFAGVSGKKGEEFIIKKRCNRLYSFIDMVDNTRGFGAPDRFKEFIKGKINYEDFLPDYQGLVIFLV